MRRRNANVLALPLPESISASEQCKQTVVEAVEAEAEGVTPGMVEMAETAEICVTRLSTLPIKEEAVRGTGTGAGPLAILRTAVMHGTAQCLPNTLPIVVDSGVEGLTSAG